MNEEQKIYLEKELLDNIHFLRKEKSNGSALMSLLKNARLQGLMFEEFYEMSFYSGMGYIKPEYLLTWTQSYESLGLTAHKAGQYFDNFFLSLTEDERKKMFCGFSNGYTTSFNTQAVKEALEHNISFSPQVWKVLELMANIHSEDLDALKAKNEQVRSFNKLETTLDNSRENRARSKI